jgi:N-acetylglutamate synthase-like GNAT family acetyltransferase
LRVTADRVLARLESADLDAVRAALTEARLPASDIGESTTFYRLDDETGVLGWAALERHGAHALLRSVLIAPRRRGTGAGRDLIERIAGVAASEGIRRLWLLTESAAPFFARLGFVPAERATAPAAIAATSEFALTCPASATCMTMALDGER